MKNLLQRYGIKVINNQIAKADVEKAIKVITAAPAKYSEQEALKLVKEDGRNIQYIENPSVAVQLAALKQDHFAFRYIKNPSEAVQLFAVKMDVPYYNDNLQFIKNPSEEVQLAAVKNKKGGGNLEYIKNPSEEMQWAAIKNGGCYIEYIKNPSEEIQLAAVKNSYSAIKYIKNPSEEVQLAAVKHDKNAFHYIKDPSDAVKKLIKPKKPNLDIDLESFWNSFPPSFKKDFKDFDSSISNGDSFRVTYKKAFKGKRSLYDQFLVFEVKGNKIEVSYETYERHTGRNGNSGPIGTYPAKDINMIVNGILEEDVFGN